ncbi:MAG TPA: hypothetical protein VGM51_07015 [Armatimonadota bacterium]|jgi:predicted MFS family arabinose efflux permease
MKYLKTWYALFRSAETWWQRTILITALALVLVLMAFITITAVSIAVRFLTYFMTWLVQAAPVLVVLTILTHLMGKPGKTIRRGVVEIINNVIIGFFAVVGVRLPEDKERKRHRRADDDDDEQ